MASVIKKGSKRGKSEDKLAFDRGFVAALKLLRKDAEDRPLRAEDLDEWIDDVRAVA